MRIESLSGYLMVPKDQPEDLDVDEYVFFNDYEEACEAASQSDEQSWTIVWFEAITTEYEEVATYTHNLEER